VDPKAGISVVIIAYNEANNIGRCIDSVADIASEILVVDSFSTDNTQAIAASKGARVIQHAFEGHIQQKNWAKDQATFDWVLSLDADECLSPPLRHNLQNAIQQGLIYGKTKGYTFSRLNHLGQRAIRGCGWYPDRKMRLWDRTSGSWAGKNPHDKFVIDSQYHTGSIEGDILHYTYPNLDAVKKQAIKFGKIGGAALRSFWNIEDNGTVSQRFFGPRQSGIYLIFFFKLLTAGLSRFMRNYFIKGGWKYGKDGLVICYWQMAEATLKYAWALFSNNNNNNNNNSSNNPAPSSKVSSPMPSNNSVNDGPGDQP
jgi:glycosyltransferase involved in cell wall biosynthesis